MRRINLITSCVRDLAQELYEHQKSIAWMNTFNFYRLKAGITTHNKSTPSPYLVHKTLMSISRQPLIDYISLYEQQLAEEYNLEYYDQRQFYLEMAKDMIIQQITDLQ